MAQFVSSNETGAKWTAQKTAAALADEMGDESEDEPGPPAEVIKSPDPDHEGNYPDQPRKGDDEDDDDE